MSNIAGQTGHHAGNGGAIACQPCCRQTPKNGSAAS